MRQVLLFAAWAWANAEACASCQGKAWTRRSGNDDNNNAAISLNSGGIFEQFACGTVPASDVDMGKRASVMYKCPQQDVIQTALKTCAQYAEAAAKEAKKGGELFEYFFKKENDAQRGEVAGNFEVIAKECQAGQGGSISITCDDNVIGSCGSTYTAWARTKEGGSAGTLVQLCPLFFGNFKGDCGQIDRASVLVHEFSHSLVGTLDFNKTYGLAGVRNLSAPQNINHADTWGLFARSAFLGCTIEQLKNASQEHGPTPELGTQLPPELGTQLPPELGTIPGQVTRPTGTGPTPEPGTIPGQVTGPTLEQDTQLPALKTILKWIGLTAEQVQGTGSSTKQGTTPGHWTGPTQEQWTGSSLDPESQNGNKIPLGRTP